MLKKLIFKEKNGTDKNVLEFDEKVNIIVGPKGSGKSTLLKLIAFAIAEEKFIETKPFLAGQLNCEENIEYNLDSEQKSFSIAKGTKSDLRDAEEIVQEKIEGYITQDDDRKTSLDTTENVENNKKKKREIFVRQINGNAAQEKCLFSMFESLKDEFSNYQLKTEQKPHAPVIFEVTKPFDTNKKQSEYWFDINFNNKVVNNNFDQLINQYKEDMQKEFGKAFTDYEKFVNLAYESRLCNVHEKDQKLKIRKEIYDLFEKQMLSFVLEIEKRIKKCQNGINSFAACFQELSRKYKDEIQKEQKEYQSYDKLKTFFADALKLIFNINKKLKDVINTEITINWDYSIKGDGSDNFIYKITPFSLDMEEKQEIFKRLFGMSKDNMNIYGLICNKTANKEITSTISKKDKEDIINFLVFRHLKVYAGDVPYENLSQGQKTLFGVTYTIKNVSSHKKESKYLLLDQIEDNLDNRTIFSEILPLLKEQKNKGKQMFIVTHNSNIGLLLDGKTISTNLFAENLRDKFKIDEVIIKDNNKKETADFHYLEGGAEAFELRKEVYDEKMKNIKSRKEN